MKARLKDLLLPSEIERDEHKCCGRLFIKLKNKRYLSRIRLNKVCKNFRVDDTRILWDGDDLVLKGEKFRYSLRTFSEDDVKLTLGRAAAPHIFY